MSSKYRPHGDAQLALRNDKIDALPRVALADSDEDCSVCGARRSVTWGRFIDVGGIGWACRVCRARRRLS